MTPRVFRPAEYVFIAANLVFAIIWSTVGRNMPHAAIWMSGHLVAAFLSWRLVRAPEPCPPPGLALRDVYPLLGIALFWTEIGILNRARPETAFHDAWVERLDARVFGMNPHLTWKIAVPEVAWMMDALYLGYYVLVFGLPILFLIRRQRPALRQTAYRLLYTYVGCDVLYALFPAHGPRLELGLESGTGTWLAGLEDRLRAAGDSPGTAFPSSHVAGVFAAALIARQWLPRRVGNAWFIAACGVALSTIYTQNHYAIDVVYGIALAFLLDRVMPRGAFSEDEPKTLPRPRFPRTHPQSVLAKRARIRHPERVMS